jgi:hypothetical protein
MDAPSGKQCAAPRASRPPSAPLALLHSMRFDSRVGVRRSRGRAAAFAWKGSSPDASNSRGSADPARWGDRWGPGRFRTLASGGLGSSASPFGGTSLRLAGSHPLCGTSVLTLRNGTPELWSVRALRGRARPGPEPGAQRFQADTSEQIRPRLGRGTRTTVLAMRARASLGKRSCLPGRLRRERSLP